MTNSWFEIHKNDIHKAVKCMYVVKKFKGEESNLRYHLVDAFTSFLIQEAKNKNCVWI